MSDDARQAKADTRSASEPMMSKAQPVSDRERNSVRMRVVSFFGGTELTTERADLRSYRGR